MKFLHISLPPDGGDGRRVRAAALVEDLDPAGLDWVYRWAAVTETGGD